jgi:hypothetical protein
MAHSARQVAWVADRHGTALEALSLVTLHEARGSSPNSLAGANSRRPRWIRCAGGIAEGRKAGVKVETFGELQSTSGKQWTECTFGICIIQ